MVNDDNTHADLNFIQSYISLGGEDTIRCEYKTTAIDDGAYGNTATVTVLESQNGDEVVSQATAQYL